MTNTLDGLLLEGWQKIEKVNDMWEIEIMLIGGISVSQVFQAEYIHELYTFLDQDVKPGYTRPEFLTLSGTAIVRANILYIRPKDIDYHYAVVKNGYKNIMLCKEKTT